MEGIIGEPLEWERLDRRRASRIALYRDGSIRDDPEKLAELRAWALEKAVLFDKAFRDRLTR